MGNAAVVSIASRASVSIINNRFDLSKVSKDLTSKDSLKNLAISMATAGATAGMTQALDIGKLSAGMGMAERAKIVTQQSMVNIGVRGAMAGATGEKLTGIMRSEVLSSGLAIRPIKDRLYRSS
jgi:filamentous hemagglutinin